MASTYINFIYRSLSSNLNSTEQMDREYQKVYKPLVKFLFTHPEFHFTFYLTGPALQFYKKKKSEFITILKQLSERNQIEVLGGGFYDPVLPLLYTADRNGQLDMLSAEIRQTIGKRPRGCSLFADCWDCSLVNNLSTCGIEFVTLDSSFIPAKKQRYIPLIMSNLGKSIEIIPLYQNFVPDTDISCEEYINNLCKAVEKVWKKDSPFQSPNERLVSVQLNEKSIKTLIENDWFASFLESASKDERIATTTCSEFRNLCPSKEMAFIPAGISSQISKWISRPFIENESKQNYLQTVYDFMETYPVSRELYNRILYVSMLVNQYKKDKMRKNSAREKLWQAQNGFSLLCSPNGAFSTSINRQQAYKSLMEAEKILREDENFHETFSCFDYDCDGANEYICRMKNYFACINTESGAIRELDTIKNTGNYADNISRNPDFDGNGDNYKRGIFVDHVFTESQFEKYKEGLSAGDGIFSRIIYNQIKFSPKHFELQLSARAYFGSSKQKIFLRKKYIINSSGMIIQYILKNESEKPLNGVLAVESNIAHTHFNQENLSYFNLETADSESKRILDTSKSLIEQNEGKLLDNVDSVRLSDTEGTTSFTFEPNENSQYLYYPLIIKRPDYNGTSLIPVQMTFVSTLFWNINIESEKEIEKTITFTITNLKKERKSKLN